MCLDTYTALVRCLGIVPTLSKLATLIKVSKGTLEKIANGRGKYKGCHSTRLKLESFILKHEYRPGRPFHQQEEAA